MTSSPLVIGVDFDNTIVGYDRLFHRVCCERGLIPEDLPPNKSDVRDYLRAVGREDDWTEVQGYVYGARMREADPFPGVLEFFRACAERGVPVCIISHKTQYPFMGERYDLHASARGWLEVQGFFDGDGIGLPRERVHFELTREEKLRRIGCTGCTHFIDDLPEILTEDGFPAGVERILFDPNSSHGNDNRFTRVESWLQIREKLCR